MWWCKIVKLCAICICLHIKKVIKEKKRKETKEKKERKKKERKEGRKKERKKGRKEARKEKKRTPSLIFTFSW